MQRLTHTPYYDAWLAALRQALEPRGSKIALAHHMAAARSQPLSVWKSNVSRIHRTPDRIINAEDLLAISAWPPLAAILHSNHGQPLTPRPTRTPASSARPATIRNNRTARNA